jgi:hypothetical protein
VGKREKKASANVVSVAGIFATNANMLKKIIGKSGERIVTSVGISEKNTTNNSIKKINDTATQKTEY